MAPRKKSKGSIYDVAKASGVSIGTVSRVFNEKRDVAEATRKLVLEAAKKVNYMPRISTRRVNIGLIVEELEKANEVGYVSDIVSTLAKHMALGGGVLELVSLQDLDAVYRNYMRGVIAVVFAKDLKKFAALRHVPLILINNVIEGPNYHYVASDHAQGVRLAAEHLLGRGHRKIGFLEVVKDTWASRQRQRGFREAFEKLDVKLPGNLMRFCENRPARDAVIPLLEAKPTALIVCGEDLSLEVSKLLIHDFKVEIPKDLSLVTFETPIVSSLLSPPQTTVAQPWEEIGRQAVEGIIGLVEGKRTKPLRVLLPNRLIERGSVRSL